MKRLKTINVDYLSNAYAGQIINKMTSEGWGIDAMVEDSNRNTWITFYRYETKENSVGSQKTPGQD
jgi:hypothetical protein